MNEPTMAPTYRIVVQGTIDQGWSDWLGRMCLRHGRDAVGEPVTILTGPVADQSALRGLLSRLWNLNLSVVAVQRVRGRRVAGRNRENQSRGGV